MNTKIKLLSSFFLYFLNNFFSNYKQIYELTKAEKAHEEENDKPVAQAAGIFYFCTT